MQKPFRSVLVALIALCFFTSCNDSKNDSKKIDYKTAIKWCNNFKKKFPHPMIGKMDSASIVKASLEKEPFCYGFFVTKDIYTRVKGNNPNVMLFMGMFNFERCFVLVPADENWQPIVDATRPIYCLITDNGLCPKICDINGNYTIAIDSSSDAANFVGYTDALDATNGLLKLLGNGNGDPNQPNVIYLVDADINHALENDPYMRLAFAWNNGTMIVCFGVKQDGNDDGTFTVLDASDLIHKSLPDGSAGHHHDK